MADLPEYIVRAKYWQVEIFDYETHVYPLEDWQEHVLGEICKCKPTKKTVNLSTMYVHNSFDGREVRDGKRNRTT